MDDAVRQGITSISKAVFLPLFQAAIEKTFTPGSILESFISTGLIPFNPQKGLTNQYIIILRENRYI